MRALTCGLAITLSTLAGASLCWAHYPMLETEEGVVGPIALQAIHQFHVTKALIGIDGASVKQGFTAHFVESADLVRKMAGTLDLDVSQLMGNEASTSRLNAEQFVDDRFGNN